jgi:GDP-L-fucose synthase
MNLVLGGSGLLGSALVQAHVIEGFQCLSPSSAELNLLHEADVFEYIQKAKPKRVFLAAARVGGILANSQHPVPFIEENLMMQSNVVRACYKAKVEKLMFLGSSCIYPRMCDQPMKEEYLLTGPLEPTNETYAIAKIAGIKMCQAYNKEYGTNYISVIPPNVYGPRDHFGDEKSHVVPALIDKIHRARIDEQESVVIWGTGKARREFIYSEDLARMLLKVMDLYNSSDILNTGTGEDVSIFDLVHLISGVVGYEGRIQWDTTKPDGMPRKLVDSSRMHALGIRSMVPLEGGLRKTYAWYLQNSTVIPEVAT